MSGSSNDHVHRDGDRLDEMDDIFSTLSPRQLNVLYGVLTNNSCRTVFMDRLQDIVVANLDNTARDGPPQKAMSKAMPKTLSQRVHHFQTSRPSDYSQALQTSEEQRYLETRFGYCCDTAAAATFAEESPQF